MFSNESQNFIDLVVFDGGTAELNFVGHLVKTEASFQRLKVATLHMRFIIVVIEISTIRRVLLLCQIGLAYLSKLLDL